MNAQAQAISHYLEQAREAMEATLTRLVAIETPSSHPETHFEAFDLLQELFADLDYHCRYVHDRNGVSHLFARPHWHRRGDPYQLLIGHVDTVWPVGSLREMPLQQEDGKLAGPGIYDMKTGLIQAIFAVKTARSTQQPLPASPVFFINADEEIGSKGSRRFIERLARYACRAFVMEPSLGSSGKLKTARKGVGRYRLSISGKAAHAGLDPEGGASAILELSHQIQKLFALNDPAAGVTVNVGLVDGGLQPNVIAPESSATIDVRVPDMGSAQRVHEAIHALQPTVPGVTLKVEGQIGRPPMEWNERNRRLWEQAQEAAGQAGIELDHGMAGGGSDGNFTSQFTPTLDGLGAVGAGAHARHEHIQLDKLRERTTLLTLLLLAPVLR